MTNSFVEIPRVNRDIAACEIGVNGRTASLTGDRNRYCLPPFIIDGGGITVCTVVLNCCQGDSPCQWNTLSFRP